jgi:hypothetical protein
MTPVIILDDVVMRVIFSGSSRKSITINEARAGKPGTHRMVTSAGATMSG